MNPPPHLPRTLKVHVGAFAGLSRIFSPDGLNISFPSQGRILEDSSMGMVGMVGCGNGGRAASQGWEGVRGPRPSRADCSQ